MNVLLDYLFKVTQISPVPAANTDFLRQVCVVVKPKAEVPTGVITLCTSASAVSALTDNAEVAQLFNAGMNRVYILPMDNLQLADVLNENLSKFFTVLASSDFNDGDLETIVTPAVKAEKKVQDILYRAKTAGVAGNSISVQYADELEDGTASVESVTDGLILVHIESGVTPASAIASAIGESEEANALVEAIVDEGDEADPQETQADTHLEGGVNQVTSPGEGLDLGEFKGVFGWQTQDDEVAGEQAIIERRSAWVTDAESKAKNMFFAFGKLLSRSVWKNNQYIQLPFDNGITDLGDAENYQALRVSFSLTDAQYGNRLAFFAAGGLAIVAPYIVENFKIDLQGAALQWIANNEPDYTPKSAAILQEYLQERVADSYVSRELLRAATVEITLEGDDFVASGTINVARPRALWKVNTEMRQTL